MARKTSSLIVDTLDVRKDLLLGIAAALCAGVMPSAGQTALWQKAIDTAAKATPDAEIVVTDVGSGRVIAAHRLEEAARTLAAPGSTLKPIALYQLIEQKQWNPARRIACSRSLHVAGRALNCPHPTMPAFDAEEALTWSCNTYFATVAASLKPGELRTLLAPSGLLSTTGLTGSEAVARIRDTRTIDETQLEFLGVDGVEVTPLELVRAYRWLAQEFAAHPASDATRIVLGGMKDSASFGMAGTATLGGAPVAGKTGTASGEKTPHTHGWFAGLAPADAPRVAIVVYQPVGHGADAARIAADVLARSPLRKP